MIQQRLSNEELLSTLSATWREEGVLVARVIVMLMEVEDRRLHLELACSSMFDFCTRRLGMSEGEAFRRITAARLSKRFPPVLEAVRKQRVHLSSLVLLRDLFTRENVDELLAAAAGKTKRAVQELVAKLAPRPDVSASIRRLPQSRDGSNRRHRRRRRHHRHGRSDHRSRNAAATALARRGADRRAARRFGADFAAVRVARCRRAARPAGRGAAQGAVHGVERAAREARARAVAHATPQRRWRPRGGRRTSARPAHHEAREGKARRARARARARALELALEFAVDATQRGQDPYRPITASGEREPTRNGDRARRGSSRGGEA